AFYAGGFAGEAGLVEIVDVVALAVEDVEQLAVDLETDEVLRGPGGAQVDQQGGFTADGVVLDQRVRAQITQPRGGVEFGEDRRNAELAGGFERAGHVVLAFG